jgi:uncharacterized membrane protein (DUF485 family)
MSMPALDQPSPPPEVENEAATRWNTRLGLVLFFIYFAVYGAFMALNAFAPGVMKLTLSGVNLAIIYGIGLIVFAVALAVLYLVLCRGQASGGREPAETFSLVEPKPITREADAPRSPGGREDRE